MAISPDKQRLDIELEHKSLRGTQWQLASDPTKSYNCIAFVLGITSQRWQPEPLSGDYWPKDIPQTDTEEAWLALFEKFGFERCADGNPEDGFTKIVIYVDDIGASHVAKIIGKGTCHGKMGHLADIIHPLHAVDYGHPKHFLKQRTPAKRPSKSVQRRSRRN